MRKKSKDLTLDDSDLFAAGMIVGLLDPIKIVNRQSSSSVGDGGGFI